MADAEGPQLAPALALAGDGPPAASGAGKLRVFLLLCVAAVLVAAGAGYGAALLFGPARADAETPAPAPVVETPAAQGPESEEFVYFDFEPTVVNLDEPRLARYVRVTITLAVKPEYKEAVQKTLERRKPELKNWLTVFFASCTLDEVRGSANLNRLRREILDNFSRQLWPDSKSLISHVLFKEFAVQ